MLGVQIRGLLPGSGRGGHSPAPHFEELIP